MLGKDPGATQAANKTLTGITPDSLTNSQSTFAQNKNANTYQKFAGSGRVRKGVRSGDGKPSEAVRSKYYWANEVQEVVWDYLSNNDKPPANAVGRGELQSRVQEVQNRMVAERILDTPDPDDSDSTNICIVTDSGDPQAPNIACYGRLLHGMISAAVTITAEV